MKVIWEESDIVGGMIVGRPGRMEQCIVSWMPSKTSSGNDWMLTSLSDGMIIAFNNMTDLAEYLTSDGQLPVSMLNRNNR